MSIKLSLLTVLTVLHLSTINSLPTIHTTSGSIQLIDDGDILALSKNEAEELSNRLITDPLKLLRELKKYESEFEELVCNRNLLNCKTIQEIFKNNRIKNPIFLIGECNAEICGLSRHQNANRSFYEKIVVKYLKQYKNQKRINFVAFASGGLFQELIILAQAIHMHNIKNINIHLVDPCYGPFIQTLSNITGQSNVINLAHDNNVNFYDYSVTQESAIERQKTIEAFLITEQEKFRQFVSIVKQLSDNNINVFVHESAKAYCQFCAHSPDMRADVLATMDLDPQMHYETAIKDYYSLIYHTLKTGGVAILLDNYLGAEKLNLINYVAYIAPKVLFWFMPYQKKIADLLQYLDKYNTLFVGVHQKKAACSDECLQNLDSTFAQHYNNYSTLYVILKKLDANEFVTHRHEFNSISATQIVCTGVLIAGGIYASKYVRKQCTGFKTKIGQLSPSDQNF